MSEGHDQQPDQIRPMTAPRLTAVAPLLLVREVQASAVYWRDCVGFQFERLRGDPPAFVMLHRDEMTLMLQQAPAGHEIVLHWKVVPKMNNIYSWVDGIDALHGELRDRGAIIDFEVGDKDNGCRELGIRDPADHDVAFGEIINPDD